MAAMTPPGMAKTVSVVREKTKKPTPVSSAFSMPSMTGLSTGLGPKGLDANRDAWANALQTMGGVYTPDPLTAVAKVAGMGLAGYGQSKATRAKEEGSSAYKAKLADVLSGKADNVSLMGMMADPYADEQSQRMLWDMYQRNNPTQDEVQQRQMRDLQMQQTQQGMTAQQQQMEAARIQQEQQATAWQQQQDEIQRQQAIRGAQQDTVSGFMDQQEAQGGDLFDPNMQAWLRQQGVAGVNPQDTQRYDRMQPYAQSGDFENAFKEYAAQPDPGEGFTLGKGQIRYDANGNPIAAGPEDVGEDGKPIAVGKGSSLYDPVTKQFITPPAGSPAQQQAIDDPMKISKDYQAQPGFERIKQIAPTINSMVASLDDPSAMADLDFVYGLAKILDPTSVVRESEAGMVIDSQGIGPSLLGQLNKILSGNQAMLPEVRQKLVGVALRRAQELQQQAQQEREFYGNMAQENGFNPDTYLQQVPVLPGLPTDDEGWTVMPDGTRIRKRGP